MTNDEFWSYARNTLSSKFWNDAKKSLAWFTELRWRAIAENVDPRAFRLALKFAMKVDDQLAKKYLSKDEDELLDKLIDMLFDCP
jgi:replication fork clamp-binding protein CrfC